MKGKPAGTTITEWFLCIVVRLKRKMTSSSMDMKDHTAHLSPAFPTISLFSLTSLISRELDTLQISILSLY